MERKTFRQNDFGPCWLRKPTEINAYATRAGQKKKRSGSKTGGPLFVQCVMRVGLARLMVAENQAFFISFKPPVANF